MLPMRISNTNPGCTTDKKPLDNNETSGYFQFVVETSL